MKKRSYRAQKVNEVRWKEVADRIKDKAVAWAIDVAKVEQYGVLMDSEREVMVTVKWTHPAETPAQVRAQGGRHKLKIVVALMRKLSRALWYVARGQAFDARRLFAVG